MSNLRSVVFPAAAVAALVLIMVPVYAQVSDGRISGTVRDPSGAVVPAAAVSALKQERNLAWNTSTNNLGRYAFPSLPLGTYTVRVTAPGFKSTQVRDVPLEVNASPAVDVALELGETSQSITAEASAPLLVTESGSVGQVVENKFITEIPLNGRNFQQLLNMTPGSSGGTEPSINGSGKDTNEYFLDGGSIKYRNWQGGGYRGSTPLQPSIDIIREFKVQTSAMSAEYGRSGTAITLVTKSGTNQIHGTLFEFHRNSAVAARNFFQPSVSPLKQNQFGVTVGGPVVRNRTFFLFGYEGSRIRAGTDYNVAVPSEAIRGGNFAGLHPIYDPATLRADPSRPTQTIADPFPSNRIPSGRFSRAASYFQQFYDLPNAPGDRYIISRSAPDDFNQLSLRLDHRFSDGINVYGRWTRTGKAADTPSPFTRLSPDQHWTDSPQHLTLSYTHNLRPALLLEVNYSLFRTDLRFDNPLTGTDFFGPAGVKGFEDIQTRPEYKGFPRISISGYQMLDSGLFTPVRQPQKTRQVKASLAYIRGEHILKAGFDYRHERPQFWQTLRTHGDASFGLQYTINPGRAAGSGSAYADFLLGLPTGITRSFEIDLYGELWKSAHGYIQDD